MGYRIQNRYAVVFAIHSPRQLGSIFYLFNLLLALGCYEVNMRVGIII